MKKVAGRFLIILTALIFVLPLAADEGMWLLGNLPTKQLKGKYGFYPSDQWAKHIQLSALRLPNCSASFVSPRGLVMTNWHCAEEAVQKLSTLKNNLYQEGFYAKNQSQELRTGLTLMQLVNTEEVTKKLEEIVKENEDADPAAVRNEAIKKMIDQRSKETGLKYEPVVLYQGGQYYLYGYKVYNDVRLVFTPEHSAGFFGGDADNFEYPRYNLDVSFLRAYENEEPVNSESHYFKWSKNGALEGELVFAAGHPGSTQRLFTSDALKTMRDAKVPFVLDLFRRKEIMIQQFALRGAEEKRISKSDLFSAQNVRKLYLGKLRGLQDPALVNEKKKLEAELIKMAGENIALRHQIIEGIELVKNAQVEIGKLYPLVLMVARGFGFDTDLKEGENYSETSLKYEETKLAGSLSHLIEFLGADHVLINTLLGFQGPAGAAHGFVRNLKMISEAMAVLKTHQEFQENYQQAVEKEHRGYAKLSDAMFKIFGTDVYPDATFTLRLAFGTVEGYEEYGQEIKPWTDFRGMFSRAKIFNYQEPWKISDRWFGWKRKFSLNRDVPINFISTLDITGGNSGSPVFNEDLEIVGLVFDGNIHSLASDFDYNYSKLNRAVSVHSAGIVEALSSVYNAGNLVKEIRDGTTVKVAGGCCNLPIL